MTYNFDEGEPKYDAPKEEMGGIEYPSYVTSDNTSKDNLVFRLSDLDVKREMIYTYFKDKPGDLITILSESPFTSSLRVNEIVFAYFKAIETYWGIPNDLENTTKKNFLNSFIKFNTTLIWPYVKHRLINS